MCEVVASEVLTLRTIADPRHVSFTLTPNELKHVDPLHACGVTGTSWSVSHGNVDHLCPTFRGPFTLRRTRRDALYRNGRDLPFEAKTSHDQKTHFDIRSRVPGCPCRLLHH